MLVDYVHLEFAVVYMFSTTNSDSWMAEMTSLQMAAKQNKWREIAMTWKNHTGANGPEDDLYLKCVYIDIVWKL